MNKIKQKIITILLSFTMIFALIPQLAFAETDNDNKEATEMVNVYVTMEKFTLGQGFKIEPVT